MKTVIVEEKVLDLVWEEWRSLNSCPRNIALTLDQYRDYYDYLKEKYGIIGNDLLPDGKWQISVSDEKLVSLFLMRYT